MAAKKSSIPSFADWKASDFKPIDLPDGVAIPDDICLVLGAWFRRNPAFGVDGSGESGPIAPGGTLICSHRRAIHISSSNSQKVAELGDALRGHPWVPPADEIKTPDDTQKILDAEADELSAYDRARWPDGGGSYLKAGEDRTFFLNKPRRERLAIARAYVKPVVVAESPTPIVVDAVPLAVEPVATAPATDLPLHVEPMDETRAEGIGTGEWGK